MTKEERETKQAEKYAMEPLMKYLEREGMNQTESKEIPVNVAENREVVEECENTISEEVMYEDVVAADAEMVRLLEEVENETTEWEKKKKEIIQKNKISFISDSEAIVETSKDYKYQIVMKALGDGRQRKYNIYERACNGTSKRKFGFLEDENIFLVKTIKNDVAVLRDLIDSLRGNYQGKTNIIIKTMQTIEKERLLEVEECENEYDATDMVEDFKQFMLNYPLTYGFVHFEIDGTMEVGIVGDKKTYDEILEKALPKCTRKKFNSILKAEGLLKITGNGSADDKYKCTRAICPATKKKEKLSTSKIYNLNFGDDFVREYVEAYNKANENNNGGNQ